MSRNEPLDVDADGSQSEEDHFATESSHSRRVVPALGAGGAMVMARPAVPAARDQGIVVPVPRQRAVARQGPPAPRGEMVVLQQPNAVATHPLLVQCLDQERRLDFPVKKTGETKILKHAYTKSGIFVKRGTQGAHQVNIVSHEGKFGCLVTTKNACKTFCRDGTCGNTNCDFYHADPGTVMAGPIGSEHGNTIVSLFDTFWRESNRISSDLLSWSEQQQAEMNASFEAKLKAIQEEQSKAS